MVFSFAVNCKLSWSIPTSWSHIFYHAYFPGPQNTKARSPSVRSNGVLGDRGPFEILFSLFCGLKKKPGSEYCSMLFTYNCSISQWKLDPGFWILDAGYWMLVSGWWIVISGCWILDAGCSLRVARLVTGRCVGHDWLSLEKESRNNRQYLR